jgi:hypothetical protein
MESIKNIAQKVTGEAQPAPTRAADVRILPHREGVLHAHRAVDLRFHDEIARLGELALRGIRSSRLGMSASRSTLLYVEVYAHRQLWSERAGPILPKTGDFVVESQVDRAVGVQDDMEVKPESATVQEAFLASVPIPAKHSLNYQDTHLSSRLVGVKTVMSFLNSRRLWLDLHISSYVLQE